MFTLSSRSSLLVMMPIILAVIAFVHSSLIPAVHIASVTVDIAPSVTADRLRAPLRKVDGDRLLIEAAGTVASISAASPEPGQATDFLSNVTDALASAPLVTKNRQILEREHQQNKHMIAVARARLQELSANPDSEHAEEYVFLTNEALDLERKNSRIETELDKNLITARSAPSERVNQISVRRATFGGAIAGFLGAIILILIADDAKERRKHRAG